MTQPVDLARTAAELSLDLHPLGNALTDCATHLAELSDLIPTRGDARLEYDELVAIIKHITNLYHDADEKLCAAACLLQHAADVPHPLPLGKPLQNGHEDSADLPDSVGTPRSAPLVPAHGQRPKES